MPDSKGLSPILRHSLESFEHGVFHYLDNTELGRKFALLHVDHSIELMLKEKVVRLGQSIYRKDGKTIGAHEAYTALESSNISVPEKPRLEGFPPASEILSSIKDLRPTSTQLIST